jgi:glycosyltransferase involved in cell wall biosynthesis
MKILFITDNFPPEVNAPASRTFEHCQEWVKQGHHVTVITGFPNFPEGKVFDGYDNKWAKIEHISGIRVVRVWTYITANEGFLKRILDYISFMASATIYSLKLGNFTHIIGTSPQFFSAVAARMTSAFKLTPYIFELRDIWPESIRAVGAMKDSKLLDLFEALELYLYRSADKVIPVTKSFKKNLVMRGIKHGKIHVVRNGADLTRYFPRDRNKALSERYGIEETFNVGYIGTHGMAHALETILDAARIIQDENRVEDSVMRFILLGSGAQKKNLIKYAQKFKINNVVFLDTVSKEEIAEHWSLLDVSVIHLRNTELFKTVIPSKLFESMAMGIPTLLGVHGESADILRQFEAGEVFEPENARALVESVRRLKGDSDLRGNYKRNALSSIHQFERKKLAQQMLDLI